MKFQTKLSSDSKIENLKSHDWDLTSELQPTPITIGWVERAMLTLPCPYGRHTPISLKAKVDTGALTSCLHALHIRLVHKEEETFVRFVVPDDNRSTEVEAPLVKRAVVKTSEGVGVERYFVEGKIVLGQQVLSILLSLNDRSSMAYNVLLGREFLKERFLVDVSRKFVLPKPRLH